MQLSQPSSFVETRVTPLDSARRFPPHQNVQLAFPQAFGDDSCSSTTLASHMPLSAKKRRDTFQLGGITQCGDLQSCLQVLSFY